MRIALIADIHGNLTALDAVLAHLERDRIDRLVCLGDVAALGPQPGEVIARLRHLGCACVLGNTDAWLIADPPLTAEPATTAPVADLTMWCAERLSASDAAFLQGLPPTVEIRLCHGRTLLAFHASPRSLDDVIAATTPTVELDAMLAGHAADIFAGGHTHIPLLRRLDHVHLVNPGSVGLPGVGPGTPDLPVNDGVHWAEYALIDAAGNGLTIAFRRLPLDVPQMLDIAAGSGMPHLDWWAARWATKWPSAESLSEIGRLEQDQQIL
jgi:putative phosphoesterase